MKRALCSATLLACAAACHVPQQRALPQAEAPATWSAPEASALEPDFAWWGSFGDPLLEALVREASSTNLDVALALSRVREARANYRAAGGLLVPQVDLSAQYARSAPSHNIPQGGLLREGDLWQAGFDASWELDFFGRNSAQVGAARADLAAAESGLAGARLTLVSELAREYVDLRGTERQLEVLRANAATQRDTLELTRSRLAAGLSTGLDESRAEAQLDGTEALIPTLEAARRAGQQSIALLLGRPPESLPAGLEQPGPLPQAPEALAAGTPAELLRRRPDVAAAEQTLAHFQELARSAEADLYPRISLHAAIGQQASEYQDLLDGASRVWTIGPSILLPIFDRGALHALADAADERARQALIGWQKTVLGAFAEVEQALTAVARERERQQKLEQALAASDRSLGYANELQARGLADFFEVIDAQRTRLLADSELAQSRTALAEKTVALYKALGGGWQAPAEER